MGIVAAKKSLGELAYDRVKEEASALNIASKSLQQQLQPFQSADDPVMAIRRSTALDGEYN